jgi:hypothetical protein
MPGLSLVQWMNMNMQQNSSFANSAMQSEYLRSLSNPNMQNLGAADLSRQLNLQNQILQQNSIQFSSPKLPQQMQPVNELSKASLPLNQLGVGTKPQEQTQDPSNLQRQQQSMNQLLPLSQSQTNLVQAQVLIQNQMQQQQPPSMTQNQQPAASQSLLLPHQQQQQHQQQKLVHQQQQLLLQQQQFQQQQQNQQQLNKMAAQVPNLASNQLQLSDQQLQLQLLQKLQQQQQSLLSQPGVTLAQLPLIQEQQKLIIDMQQQLSNSQSLSQQQIMPQQSTKVPSQATPPPPTVQQESQQKLPQKHIGFTDTSHTAIPPTTSVNAISAVGSPLMATGATHSVLTDEIPSCSTSPSTANGSHLVQPVLGRNQQCSMINYEKVPQSTAPMSIPSSLEAVTATPRSIKELPKLNSNVKQSVMASKLPNTGPAPQNLANNAPPTDYLETASSATSVWLSQADGLLHHGFPMSNFNQQQMFKDVAPETDIHGADPSNNTLFGINGDGQPGFPMGADGFLSNGIDASKYQNHISTDIDGNYRIPKDGQQEISSSMVSHSFGASDMAFNSIDSGMNDGGFMNRTSWPPPPLKRMRTFTKVGTFLFL